MARAVELAAVVGAGRADEALGLAAIAGRFADGDLASIIDHLAAERETVGVVIADEAYSVQPGTSAWALAYEVSLTIDSLDFSEAAGRTR
jgi:hypothetical protein